MGNGAEEEAGRRAFVSFGGIFQLVFKEFTSPMEDSFINPGSEKWQHWECSDATLHLHSKAAKGSGGSHLPAIPVVLPGKWGVSRHPWLGCLCAVAGGTLTGCLRSAQLCRSLWLASVTYKCGWTNGGI